MKKIIVCLVAIFALSCSKSIEQSLPLYSVNLTIDLDYEWRLQGSQAYKIFNKSNTQYQPYAQTGMGGILIYHGFDNNGGGNRYYAFDAACPYESQSNVTVEVDDEALHAICPKCGSKYELIYGLGTPIDGPSTKYLQHYPVNQTNNTIVVRNY